MSVIIGYIAGEEQELTLINGLVHINNEPQPIKNVTQEEIDAFAAVLAAAPDGDPAGQEAYRDTKRIAFLVELLSRTFGDECSEMLEHMIGNLHYRVLDYLGETDDLDEYVETRLPRHHGDGHAHEHHHEHDHHDGHCCCHDHHHD
ncbi:MAG: hypothetical protein Q4F72_02000 [Desulfovibrionaceae bacterium]|nr:hypothetical protein [Desulfovibrionaceae bacterium]